MNHQIALCGEKSAVAYNYSKTPTYYCSEIPFAQCHKQKPACDLMNQWSHAAIVL
jgi:hypothetical protein